MTRPTELKDVVREHRRFSLRLAIGAGVVLVMFVFLGARFFWLQVWRYDHYRTLAEENRISVVPAPPNRGIIVDHRGTVLAHNFAAYTLEITPSRVGKLDATIDALAALVEITPAHRKRFKRLLEESKDFESLPIRNRLTELEVARFAAQRYRFPGVEVRARLFRHYPQTEMFSHVVGYIGRINQDDENRLEAEGKATNYRGSDHIGKSGVEESYEYFLHGTTGAEQVEIDAGGHAVRVLSRKPPLSGDRVILHLDAGLQEVAWRAFGDRRGALVALDPKTGGVLAFVSKPGFDPNPFVDGIDPVSWLSLNESLDKPLVNRGLRGIYPPGSTFKPFMALAGLHYGVRRPGDTIVDPGYYSLPGSSHRYRDWKEGGHGVVDLKRSIVISCDTYYYRLAHDLGIERINKFIGQFGFGKRTDIDMKGELAGLLPSEEWKQRRFKQKWYAGETVIVGIGQGYNLATPLQLAVAAATIANDGIALRPQLVKAIENSRTHEFRVLPPRFLHRVETTPEHLALVKQAMVEVTKPGGTAAVAGANTPYLFAGKTGTAQVIGLRQGEKFSERRVAERLRDHALFIAFAPADNPRIAMGVLVENGGHGGSAAAPIARAVTDYWLLGKRPAAPAVPESSDEPDAD